ncbi:hypothetical protein, variant 1 [Aphanomyces invadans]|uniref:Uncharacterized protein n=1 Tax=Aphanomyces invadans TaxID=157072 RepID=A0A024U844_9STRA|nr:hypothetical protein, variant 1 [Aphanomyces invadans]ETW02072.1 hypothetical protein, variant 1 [Aphanomyces invadans]|eukprot:XP_008868677.1 hypothetical protein, variant 1 [Aphanomyces invadans]
MGLPLGWSSQGSGIAMGAVLGMFWMRVIIGFTYLEASFYLIFPLSLTVVVLEEERSLGPVVDAILRKVSSLVWMAMHADAPPSIESSVVEGNCDEDATLLPRPSDPSLDVHYKASNTSDLITSANSSLFNGLQDDLVDHAVMSTGGPIYLQDTTTGFFLKYVDGKVKMTSSPDDSCLFEWVQGKTHHWGLLSMASSRFVGQNMLSQIVVSARKLNNWEAFRVLQNASLPPTSGEFGLSSPVHLVLCSARFGKGMWVSSRGQDDDKLVVGLAKHFHVALRLRYATSLDVFQSAALPSALQLVSPLASPLSSNSRRSVSPASPGATLADVAAAKFPISFHEATTRTSILKNHALPSSVTSATSFAEAYDALLPGHTDMWQVHPTHGNVRNVVYRVATASSGGDLVELPTSPRSRTVAGVLVHEFHHHEYNADANQVVFETKMTLGDGLVPSFAIELMYSMKQQSIVPSSSGRASFTQPPMALDCRIGVLWAKPCMFEGYVHLSAVRAATLHAQHLVEHMSKPSAASPPFSTTWWTMSFGALFVHEIHRRFATPTHVLAVPRGVFFERPLTPVYTASWPITPTEFQSRMLTDSAWFFRERDPATVPNALDMSPWAPCADGHIRLQRFTFALAGRQELVEEFQTYAIPEPNTLQIGRKITLPRSKLWTMDIRWDFELQEDMVSTVACAVALQWTPPRPARAEAIEKHVIAVMLASIERFHVLISSQEEDENMPWPDQLTMPLVEAIVG